MTYTPSRGDIIWTDFDPAAGHEQARKRPAVILSPHNFNRASGLALVVPITSRIRGNAFEVTLQGTDTSGVALCHHVKTIDYKSRGAKFIEEIPQSTLDEILAKVGALIS